MALVNRKDIMPEDEERDTLIQWAGTTPIVVNRNVYPRLRTPEVFTTTGTITNLSRGGKNFNILFFSC